MNKVALTGRLTRDPETREVGADNKVASFGLAVDGVKKDETHFFDIEVWGKQADSVVTYLKKGSFAIIDGRLRQDKWEKDGQKNSKVLVVADRVEFGPKPSDGGGEKESTPAPKSSGKGKASAPVVEEEDLF